MCVWCVRGVCGVCIYMHFILSFKYRVSKATIWSVRKKHAAYIDGINNFFLRMMADRMSILILYYITQPNEFDGKKIKNFK